MWFNLNSGVVVTQRTVTPLPMPDQIRKLVNRWGNKTQALKYTGGINFLDRKNNELEWENEDLGETIDDVNEPIYPTLASKIPGVVLEDDHVDEGASLEDPIPSTHRERANCRSQ